MDPMFVEGLNLMMVGMGVVFAFLVLLVWMISLMSKLVIRFAPGETAPAAVPAPRMAAALVVPAAGVDSTTLNVIRDAVRQHRAAGN